MKLDQALEAHRLEDAVQLLIELRKYEPDSARWPHKQGDLLRKLGRASDAVHSYATAVGLYAAEGFLVRAIAMAKTVVEMDPARLDVLERVDPQAAQQLRAYKRPQRRTVLLDDAPLAPLPLAPASVPPTSGSTVLDRLSMPPTRVVKPARPPAPPPPFQESGTGRLARPRPAPPPVPRMSLPPPIPPKALPAAPVPSQLLAAARSLQEPAPRKLRVNDLSVPLTAATSGMQEFYRRALAGSDALAPDDAFSDIELAPRTPVPKVESMLPEPISAEKLTRLPLFPLFAELPKPALDRLVRGSTLVELGHDAFALRCGDPADALYGIARGSVHIVVPGQAFQLTLAEGDVFGEGCLLEHDKYQADVIVAGELLALRVPRAVLLSLVQEYTPLAGLLLQLLTRRLLGNLLQVSPLFQDFDVQGKGELARLFEVRRARAGQLLAVVGKKLDGLYIALTGSLGVNQPGAPARVAPAGSMFGQSTVLTQAASQVDVNAQTDMILLRLPAAQFARVAMQYPTVLARLAELSTSEVVRVTL